MFFLLFNDQFAVQWNWSNERKLHIIYYQIKESHTSYTIKLKKAPHYILSNQRKPNNIYYQIKEFHTLFTTKLKKATHYILSSQSTHYMRGFAKFGLNWFKRCQKRFSQLQLSLDADMLKSCNFVFSSITTARRRFAKDIYVGTVITVSVPKCTSNIDA